jgi:hypothetical protein
MNVSSKESYIDQKLSVLKAGLESFLQGALAEVDPITQSQKSLLKGLRTVFSVI